MKRIGSSDSSLDKASKAGVSIQLVVRGQFRRLAHHEVRLHIGVAQQLQRMADANIERFNLMGERQTP